MKKGMNPGRGLAFRRGIGACLILLILAVGLTACKTGS